MLSSLKNWTLAKLILVFDEFIYVDQTVCTFVGVCTPEGLFHDSWLVFFSDIVIIEFVPLSGSVVQYVRVIVTTLSTTIVNQNGVKVVRKFFTFFKLVFQLFFQKFYLFFNFSYLLDHNLFVGIEYFFCRF